MFGLIFVISALCVCFGYLLAMFTGRRLPKITKTADAAVEPDPLQSPEIAKEIDSELTREFLESLQELAATVDGDVGRHNTRVAEINESLTSDQASSSKVVLAAAAQLMEANRQLQQDLETAKAEIRVQETQISSYMNEARTDALTGLSNRRVLDQELVRALILWRNDETPSTLMLIDVDHFKRFNDYHGHQTGDDMLRGVADVLTASTRECDIVTRYGGEEFAIVLPSTTLDEGELLSEHVREAVAEHRFECEGADLRVTVSMGLATTRPDEDRNALIKRADEALYAAKAAGRNCSFLHNGNDCRAIQSAQQRERLQRSVSKLDVLAKSIDVAEAVVK